MRLLSGETVLSHTLLPQDPNIRRQFTEGAHEGERHTGTLEDSTIGCIFHKQNIM